MMGRTLGRTLISITLAAVALGSVSCGIKKDFDKLTDPNAIIQMLTPTPISTPIAMIPTAVATPTYASQPTPLFQPTTPTPTSEAARLAELTTLYGCEVPIGKGYSGWDTTLVAYSGDERFVQIENNIEAIISATRGKSVAVNIDEQDGTPEQDRILPPEREPSAHDVGQYLRRALERVKANQGYMINFGLRVMDDKAGLCSIIKIVTAKPITASEVLDFRIKFFTFTSPEPVYQVGRIFGYKKNEMWVGSKR